MGDPENKEREQKQGCVMNLVRTPNDVKAEAIVDFPKPIGSSVNRAVIIPISADGKKIYLKKGVHYKTSGRAIVEADDLQAGEVKPGDIAEGEGWTSEPSGKYYNYKIRSAVREVDGTPDGYKEVTANEFMERVKKGEIGASEAAALVRNQLRTGKPPIVSLGKNELPNNENLKQYQSIDDGEGYDRAVAAGRVEMRIDEDPEKWVDVSGEVVKTYDEVTTLGVNNGKFLLMVEASPNRGHEGMLWLVNGAREKLNAAIQNVSGDELVQEAGTTAEEMKTIEFHELGGTHSIPILTAKTDFVLATGISEKVVESVERGIGADEPMNALEFDLVALPEMLQMIAYGVLDRNGNTHQLDDRLVCGVALALKYVNEHKDEEQYRDLARKWNLRD